MKKFIWTHLTFIKAKPPLRGRLISHILVELTVSTGLWIQNDTFVYTSRKALSNKQFLLLDSKNLGVLHSPWSMKPAKCKHMNKIRTKTNRTSLGLPQNTGETPSLWPFLSFYALPRTTSEFSIHERDTSNPWQRTGTVQTDQHQAATCPLFQLTG